MKLFSILFLCLTAVAGAQGDFHVYADRETLLEGGVREMLTVFQSNLRYNIRSPKGWYRKADEPNRKILFTSPDGKSAVAVRFTDKSPGVLPEADVLKATALQEHPGARDFYSATFPTSYRPGRFFDLAAVPAPHIVQKIRHAFVPGPAGEVEFVLSSSDDDFQKNSHVLMNMLGAFKVGTLPAKTR